VKRFIWLLIFVGLAALLDKCVPHDSSLESPEAKANLAAANRQPVECPDQISEEEVIQWGQGAVGRIVHLEAGQDISRSSAPSLFTDEAWRAFVKAMLAVEMIQPQTMRPDEGRLTQLSAVVSGESQIRRISEQGGEKQAKWWVTVPIDMTLQRGGEKVVYKWNNEIRVGCATPAQGGVPLAVFQFIAISQGLSRIPSP